LLRFSWAVTASDASDISAARNEQSSDGAVWRIQDDNQAELSGIQRLASGALKKRQRVLPRLRKSD
jgi:hypothetical protein